MRLLLYNCNVGTLHQEVDWAIRQECRSTWHYAGLILDQEKYGNVYVDKKNDKQLTLLKRTLASK